MFEVVLVDDDVIVIEFLKRFIPWEDYGFRVVASFQDSNLALAYLQENDYDVLITDIGMPKLNGIELIEQLKKSKTSSYNVILSCQDDFHFAQQALKLQVFDYILKETMEETNIIALLDRLKNKLEQEHYKRNQHLKVTKFIERNNMTLKSKFIEKVMKEQHIEKTIWFQEQEELLGLDFTQKQYTPILCFIDQYQEAIKHYENETWLQFAINNMLEETLIKVQSEIQIFFVHGEFFMLFQSDKTIDSHYILESIVKEIHNKIRSFLSISITSVIGEKNVKGQELIENMRLLLSHKEHRLYYHYDSINFFQPIHYTCDSIFQDYVEISQKIKEMILKGEKNELLECISQQLHRIREKNFSPGTIKNWVIKLVYDVKLSLNALKHFETQLTEITDHEIQYVETFEHLESVLENIFNQMLEQTRTINLTSRNEDILKAQKYVQIHLGDKISLKEVADHLHLNPSYFSRMYKKETGEGFVEYVTKVKMAKAIELLDHSTKSVEQIAFALGFESKSYFLKTFKKYYGISPKSYRFKDKEAE
ncbi:response regulator transcription factor [Bacillus timonensis]|uniref:response regulator transcription factor n=1 Tax=Bacillus timonensis TaxID=1033734 RepID=UPI00028A1145|nr:helix-turn-helix domain-containing protein [Bacillus timonensis]